MEGCQGCGDMFVPVSEKQNYLRRELCHKRVLADRGYSFSACRILLRQRDIPHTILERRDQREVRSKRSGRPPGFDADLYARRNVVERCVNRHKQRRGSPPVTRGGRELQGGASSS